MSVDKNYDDIVAESKKVFEEKIRTTLSADSQNALDILIDSGIITVDWYDAFSVFTEIFPEILRNSDGMTIAEISDALSRLSDESLHTFSEWYDQNGYDWYDPEDNYNFTEVCEVLSSFMWECEIRDSNIDCDKYAEYIARQIYK